LRCIQLLQSTDLFGRGDAVQDWHLNIHLQKLGPICEKVLLLSGGNPTHQDEMKPPSPPLFDSFFTVLSDIELYVLFSHKSGKERLIDGVICEALSHQNQKYRGTAHLQQ
jgi:hypothetical protein